MIAGQAGYLPRPPRRDRDAYFATAYGLLADRGHEGLTVAALCNRLGTSTGSFYHHFDDLPGFVAAFATRWRDWMVGRFEGFQAEPDLRRRFEITANGSHATTFGSQPLRAWAATNPVIADAALRPYLTRQALVVDTFVNLAEDQDSGEVFAGMVLAMCVGAQLRPQRVDRTRWMRILAQLYHHAGLNVGLSGHNGRTHLKVFSRPRMEPVSTTPGSLPALAGRHPAPPVVQATGSTREHYFAVARELLAEQGSDAVTATALVTRLELTKGSFQHHFGGMPGFLQAFADNWEQDRTARIQRCLAQRNPRLRLELLNADLLVSPDPAETAWRAWGYTAPSVGGALRRVDQLCQDTLATTLAQLCDDPAVDLLAEMTFDLMLGLHQWYPPFEPELAARVAVEWMRRFLDIDTELSSTASGCPALVFGHR